jgi:hypothetical protein
VADDTGGLSRNFSVSSGFKVELDVPASLVGITCNQLAGTSSSTFESRTTRSPVGAVGNLVVCGPDEPVLPPAATATKGTDRIVLVIALVLA